MTTTNKALFTTEVSRNQIDPSYLWYLQEKIDAEADATVFVCGNNFFAFNRSRASLKGLDWRSEQVLTEAEVDWIFHKLSSSQIKNIEKFIFEIDVDFGRIDFLIRNDEMIFLEFNANGQWIFLDYSEKIGLLNTVAEYLKP